VTPRPAGTVVRQLIEDLRLEPHPEGGWFRRTFTHHDLGHDGRPLTSAILYLLGGSESSHWHRIDAVELWHFHAGDPLVLQLSPDGSRVRTRILGPDPSEGHEPQVVVPAGTWQAARSLGLYTLVGCTVTPAFVSEGFELAPPGWQPE
jgi:predicted cupin superfamily sugar epimerase